MNLSAAPHWGAPESSSSASIAAALGAAAAARERTLCVALGLLALCGCYAYAFPATYGDAAIYFPYFKGFFDLPFSFQPHHVSYGATSPLHVIVFAPVYRLGGAYWLHGAKVVNFLFVVAGVWLLYRSTGLAAICFPLLCVAVCAFEVLLVSVAQLYETGLAFLGVSLWLYWARRERLRAAVLLAGVLPLIRPELGLISAVLFCDLVVWRRQARWLPVFVLSALPLAAYAGYMAAAGAGVVPASVLSRALRSVEHHATWVQRWVQAVGELYAEEPACVCGAVVLLASVAWRGGQARWEAIAGLPLLALYTLCPPGPYLARYLCPVVPVMVLSAAALIGDAVHRAPAGWRRHGTGHGRLAAYGGIALLIAAAVHGYWSQRQIFRRYDLGTWLLRDLASALNPMSAPADKILLYEVQGQYSLKGYAVSVDGTVGNEMQPVLLGEETVAAFLERTGIRFVVTSNSFAYRKIFDRSLLADLYAFDLTSALGDVVALDGVRFRKVLTNPVFADPAQHVLQGAPDLNVGRTLRVFSPHTPAWFNYQILWNSVYEIEATAPPA